MGSERDGIAVASGRLTLGDLIDEPGLGLEMIVGTSGARRRPVSGAHSIERRHPVPWLSADWVMLTTGLVWESERAQRELISELDAGGITALGFGIDVVCREVPVAMRRAAESLGFPVFTIPEPTAFRDVIGVVQRKTLSGEIRSFGRLVAMQRYLNDALVEDDPAACIIDRLGTLLGANAAIVDHAGTVVLGTCPIRREELAKSLRSVRGDISQIQTERLAGCAFRVHTRSDSRNGWLVVTTSFARLGSPLLKPVAQAALPLLEATSRLRDLRLKEERAAQSATLDALLEASTPQDAYVASARAASWHVNPDAGVRVLVARPDHLVDGVPPEGLDRMVSKLRASGIASLATQRQADLYVLLPANVSLEAIERIILDVQPSLRLAVGRVVHSATVVNASRADAELVLRWDGGAGTRCLTYDDLDLPTTLLAEVPAERIAPKVEPWFRVLSENPMLLETLRAYFEHDLDVGSTSRALHLHPNSTRYRLARLQELLGVSLRRPSVIAALYLALLSQECVGAIPHRVGTPEPGDKESIESHSVSSP